MIYFKYVPDETTPGELNKMKHEVNNIVEQNGYFIKERSKMYLSSESIDSVVDMLSTNQLCANGPNDNFIKNLHYRILVLVLKYSKSNFPYSHYSENLASKITEYIIEKLKNGVINQ